MSKLIIANWKMNPDSLSAANKLFTNIKKTALTTRNITTVIAPPLVFLASLAASTKARRIQFAAQNTHFADSGPQVGETSVKQAKDAGASYTLIGHSARRANGETDEDVSRKVAAALAAKIVPVLFVGETERDVHGNFLRVVRSQIKRAFADVPASRVKDVVVCYEPVWAISTSGSGKDITLSEVHQMMLYVHKVLVEMFGLSVARKVKMLYGGSVNKDNAADIFAIPGVEGAVVGGASLNALEFREVLQAANKS